MLSRRRLFGLAAAAPVAAVVGVRAAGALAVQLKPLEVFEAGRLYIDENAWSRFRLASADYARYCDETYQSPEIVADRHLSPWRTARAIPATRRAVSSDDGVGADGAAGCGVVLPPKLPSDAHAAGSECCAHYGTACQGVDRRCAVDCHVSSPFQRQQNDDGDERCPASQEAQKIYPREAPCRS